jgi:uncharacterized membrane protein
MPLHPFVVHLPIALSLLMPLLAAGALVAWWRGWLPGRKAWLAVVVFQALLVAAGFAALRTGEAEEERVEKIVPEATLEQHEELAEQLLIGAGVVLLVAAVPLVLRNARHGRAVAMLAALGMLVVTTLALETGKAGGELVYKHGAAAAYTTKAAPPNEPAAEQAGEASEHD